MVERTSTDHAPWHLIEGESKRYARVRVVETVCEAVEARL
jgi:polyphosphate kinase 2 (PPK2 family)